MRKFRFLNVSKDKRNFVVGLLASNSKKPAINYLSSRIFFELDKRFKRDDKTYYCEVSAVQIVSKILETLNDTKTKNLLIGFFNKRPLSSKAFKQAWSNKKSKSYFLIKYIVISPH